MSLLFVFVNNIVVCIVAFSIICCASIHPKKEKSTDTKDPRIKKKNNPIINMQNTTIPKEKLNIKKKYLPLSWNMFGMHKKGLFIHNWQLSAVTDNGAPFFVKYGNIWHFTGFPIEDRINIMGQVWDTFKDNYSNRFMIGEKYE